MDKAARMRWAVLLSVLALTVGAIFYPVDSGQEKDDVVGPARASVPAVAGAVRSLPLQATSSQGGTEEDPFAPRGWQAPTTILPPPVPVAAASIVPVVPPAPVGPPPLPFKFMGRLNDGGQQVLYLSRGDKTLIARNGETIEGLYKVLAIDPQAMELEYLPTGEKQTLPLTATDN